MALVTALLACASAFQEGPPLGGVRAEEAAPRVDAWWEVPVVDADQDGVSVDAGDCDDLRADVHPGAADALCDGVDQDCDGVIDGGFVPDPREEAPAPVDFGDLGEEGEATWLGTFHADGDADVFRFHVADADDAIFDVEAWVYDVPPEVDVALVLTWDEDSGGVARGVVAEADDLGVGGDEFLDFPGSAGRDDSGTYTLRVEARSGSACAPSYLLQVLVGSW